MMWSTLVNWEIIPSLLGAAGSRGRPVNPYPEGSIPSASTICCRQQQFPFDPFIQCGQACQYAGWFRLALDLSWLEG